MKRTLSLSVLTFLFAAQTAGAATAPAAKPKADATFAWKTSNNYLVGKGILPAVTGDPVVTRAQLATALVALTGNIVDIKGYHDCYKDVEKQAFAPAVCFAAKQRWIDPEKDGSFHPDSAATFGVAVQAVIRAERFSAPATRGAWYVPFVNAAVKEGIIDKADYTKTISSNITRRTLAEMLYRVLLGLKQVSYAVGATCVPVTPVSATVVQTGTATQPETSIAVLDSAGKSCIVSQDPLARTDSMHPNLQLTPLVPSLEASNEGDKTPMVDKRAYFLSKDGGLWSPYVWELDLKKGVLRQILNAESPGAVRISPKYTFLVSVGSKGVDLRAMNLKTGLSKFIRRLETRVTFLKSLTQSRSVKATDHMLIDANEFLTYNVYNMHDGSVFQSKISAKLDELFYPDK